MASLYYYLDMRHPRKDGSGSLKLGYNHNRKTAFHTMDIYLKPDEWDADHQQVVSRPDKKFHNVIIRKVMAEGILALQRIMLRKDFEGFTPKEVIDMVSRGADTPDTAENADYLVPVFNEYVTLCRKPNTASSYRAALKSIKDFEPNIDSLRFKDINVAWLRRYQQWMTGDRGMAVNGANVYLRNLRTVFNYAIQNEYTKARYPFRDIDMSTTEPDKRYIMWDRFLEWLTFPEDDFRVFYRDLFMLSFYLCGIRPVDLLMLKRDQVEDGRLVYCPHKLNGRTKLSIKIEPEAWEIIHKYEGKDHLLNVMDGRSDYRAFCQHWNRALKAVGEDEYTEKTGRKGRVYTKVKHKGIVPYITVYFARTCWATYAYNVLDIPMDTISQALGHKSGLKVTNFYVARGVEKVDRANRQLIDRLNEAVAEYRAKKGR